MSLSRIWQWRGREQRNLKSLLGKDCGWVNLVFSRVSLSKHSLNCGHKGIYIVGWEGMWKVIFCQTGCLSDLTSRLGWVASSSREQTAWPAWGFCPVVNSWCDASAFGMLGTCASIWRLAAASHPRVPASLHTLEQFFTLSHTLPLHDSHINTGLLIAKIQANLARNKANKMVD